MIFFLVWFIFTSQQNHVTLLLLYIMWCGGDFRDLSIQQLESDNIS